MRGLVEALGEYQALAADVGWSGTAHDGVRALAANPLVRTIEKAESLYAELADAHRAHLPERLDPMIEAGGWRVEPLRLGAVEMEPEHLGPPGAYPAPVQTPVYGFLLLGTRRDRCWSTPAPGRSTRGGPAPPASTRRSPGRGWRRPAVTRIVLTHLDFDHAGGVVAGDLEGPLEPAFPGLPVALADERLDWWRARTDENAGTPVLAALERAGVAVPVADGGEVLPEVVLRLAPGHRAGHACLEIGGADGLVIGADLVHDPAHMPHPEWDGAMDFDAGVALATRLAWFGRLADEGRRVHFSHVDGVGVVARVGDGFGWRLGHDARARRRRRQLEDDRRARDGGRLDRRQRPRRLHRPLQRRHAGGGDRRDRARRPRGARRGRRGAGGRRRLGVQPRGRRLARGTSR